MRNWLKKIPKSFRLVGKSQEKRYYYSLILIGFMSACIPVILIGALYYYIATTSLVDQIKSDTQSSLMLFKERVERIMEDIELDSHQLATDSLIRDSFNIPQFDQKLHQHLEILQQLKVTTTKNAFIEDIYYYNVHDNFILSNEYGYISYPSFIYQEDIQKIMGMDEQTAWVHLPVSSEKGYISYVRKLPTLTSKLAQGLLVVQVKEKLFQDYFPDQEDHSNFVLNSQYQILFQDKAANLSEMSIQENALDKIMKADSSQGVFYAKNQDGEKILYAYDVKSRFDRAYVSMIPKSVITEQMGMFRWMIIASILAFLCISILLAFFNAKRVYNPIKQLLHYSKSISTNHQMGNNTNEITVIKNCLQYLSKEKEKLGDYKVQIEPTLQEWFIQKVLEGNSIYNNQFYKKCKEYNIPIDSKLSVMVIDVVNFNDEMKFKDEDKPVVSFAIQNIIDELMKKEAFFNGFDLVTMQGNLVVVTRLQQDGTEQEANENLRLLTKDIEEMAQKYLSLTINIGVGRVYSHLSKVSISYQEALHALRYRIFKDSDTTLFIEDIEGSKKQGIFFYPREFENRLLEALKVGDIEQAEQTLNEFCKVVSLFDSYNSIYQCFHLLLSSIIFSVEEQGNSIEEIFEPDLFGQLKALHTLDEINNWFADYLFPLYQTLNNNPETFTAKSAIKQICKFINENVTEDITLTQCAEMVHLTPSYLSRLFKKEVGINFRDYVLIRKVEEAKRLSIETDARIEDIAKAVGYSERNLNRLIQRFENMTLNQYRNNNR